MNQRRNQELATIIAHVTAKTVRQIIQVEFTDDTARMGAVYFEGARSEDHGPVMSTNDNKSSWYLLLFIICEYQPILFSFLFILENILI